MSTTTRGVGNSNKITVINSDQLNDNDSENNVVDTDKQITAVDKNQLVAVSNNQSVEYDVTDLVPIPHESSVRPVVDPDNFDHFKNYVKSELCYNASILDKATVTKRSDCIAFQVDMWSLMEHRSVETRSKPYRGEPVPAKMKNNPFDWKDSEFDPSSTSIEGERIKKYPLRDTQQKRKCSSCNKQGKQTCTNCNGQGKIANNNQIRSCSSCHGAGQITCKECEGTAYLLIYDELTITWRTLYSVRCYQNTFLPPKLIRRTKNKPTFYENDIDWTSDIFLTSYENLFQIIAENSPYRFEKEIQQQYQDEHYIKLQPSTLIRRLKILIRYLDIKQVDYQLEGYINKTERHTNTNTFTYLQYGQNEKGQPIIYQNDYPVNCCGCFNPKLGCRCGCTIM